MGLLEAGLGLAGMLIRPKTPGYIKKAEGAIAEQKLRDDEGYKMAKAYDPYAEADASANYATEKGAMALARTQKNLMGEASTNGVPLGSSIGYLKSMQRATDDMLNPLQDQIMRERAAAPLKKFQVMQSVAGQPGARANAYLQIGGATPQPNMAGSMAMFAQGVDGMMQKSPQSPAQSGSPASWGGNPMEQWDRSGNVINPDPFARFKTQKNLKTKVA